MQCVKVDTYRWGKIVTCYTVFKAKKKKKKIRMVDVSINLIFLGENFEFHSRNNRKYELVLFLVLFLLLFSKCV